MSAKPPPPGIAEWIAAEPTTRVWHPAGLIIWNFHPQLGVQVKGEPLAALPAPQIHQIMVDALLAEGRGQVRHHEAHERDYRRLAQEMRDIMATVNR